ncbi:hypothetical protein BDR06DRAFT_307018 [Suillus hirtellus]|nr:hypothetical protein BDR06DRAFT_307018 [Suillus hirtellus]
MFRVFLTKLPCCLARVLDEGHCPQPHDVKHYPRYYDALYYPQYHAFFETSCHCVVLRKLSSREALSFEKCMPSNLSAFLIYHFARKIEEGSCIISQTAVNLKCRAPCVDLLVV